VLVLVVYLIFAMTLYLLPPAGDELTTGIVRAVSRVA
jgi:hypothetical protein